MHTITLTVHSSLPFSFALHNLYQTSHTFQSSMKKERKKRKKKDCLPALKVETYQALTTQTHNEVWCSGVNILIIINLFTLSNTFLFCLQKKKKKREKEKKEKKDHNPCCSVLFTVSVCFHLLPPEKENKKSVSKNIWVKLSTCFVIYHNCHFDVAVNATHDKTYICAFSAKFN